MEVIIYDDGWLEYFHEILNWDKIFSMKQATGLSTPGIVLYLWPVL